MTRTDVENDKVKPCILELYGSRQSGKVHCVKKRSEFKHGMMVHIWSLHLKLEFKIIHCHLVLRI